MITIKKSPTADTRTCDVTKVTKDQLLAASRQHIKDVEDGLLFFIERLAREAALHDRDKITEIDAFYADFQTGFAQTSWWDNHRKVNRHHINIADGIPSDVNLVDVIAHVTDCVMSGLARSGSVYDVELPSELLQRALKNTVELLKSQVSVVD